MNLNLLASPFGHQSQSTDFIQVYKAWPYTSNDFFDLHTKIPAIESPQTFQVKDAIFYCLLDYISIMSISVISI